MKLKCSDKSLQQLVADKAVGIAWPQDTFAFSQDKSELAFPCSGGKFLYCVVKITTGEATHPYWHWDGDIEEPTLTPSIGCDTRCGWHGFLTKGIISP